jgi:hypothetical protein
LSRIIETPRAAMKGLPVFFTALAEEDLDQI